MEFLWASYTLRENLDSVLSSDHITEGGGGGDSEGFEVDFFSLCPFQLFLPFKKIHLFIWLCWVLVGACEIFRCGIQTLSCSMSDLVPHPGIEPRPPVLEAWNLSP